MESTKERNNRIDGNQDQLLDLDSLHQKVEATTQKFISTFQKSAKEISEMIDHEFSSKPWVYFTTCLGAGIVLGYMVGSSKPRYDQASV